MNTARMMVLSAMTTMAIGCGGGESAPDDATAAVPPATSTEPAPSPVASPAAAPTAAPPAEAPTPAQPPAPAKTRMYVADATGKVSAFALPLTQGAAPLATVGAAAGLKSPRNVAITPTNDRIFVADMVANKVFGFDLPLTSASTPVITLAAASSPHGVAVDAAGNLWVSRFGGVVARYDAPVTSASTAAMSLSTGDSANLYDVVVDDARDTVFVASQKGLVAFVAPKNGGGPTFTMQSGTRYTGLTLRADGAIFATEFSSGLVVSFHAPFSAATTREARNSDGDGDGQGIKFLPDGSMLRTNVFEAAFLQNAPLLGASLLAAPTLSIPEGSDTPDLRGFAVGP